MVRTGDAAVAKKPTGPVSADKKLTHMTAARNALVTGVVLQAKDIAEARGVSLAHARMVLIMLCKRGEAHRVAVGQYANGPLAAEAACHGGEA